MNWIVENWSLLVVLAAAVVVIVHYIKKFTSLPSETQLQKVKEWLLWGVIYTEKTLGSGTGTAKLRFCYDLFVQRFPTFVSVVSFELFSQWVDEALVKMKAILETNKDIAAYVND